MPKYNKIQKEETLKGLVHDDYFSKFGYEPNIDNIDFVVTDKTTRNNFLGNSGSSLHYLWAESKKGSHDIFNMFTQLMLTCKKTYEKADYLAPPWLGVFDSERIAFVAFHNILPIFHETDFNWNTTPSNHETDDFQKAKKKIKKLINSKLIIFDFETDDKNIKDFIKTHFIKDAFDDIKMPITKDNFVQIFIKWVKEVKPFIDISDDEWIDFRKKGILDCDFYRADLMSEDGNTITEKLKIVLKNDNYKFQENVKGRLFTADIDFADEGISYNQFWNRYQRPPLAVYQQYIIDRRDLLVPQNIREVKGSFFTPKIWADKSKEYLAEVLGENWQDEYYIWDCAAGTGNLLVGLTNQYNLWASDIDEGNVETMQSLKEIDENLKLLTMHIFKLDFLNDDFEIELPVPLKNIIKDDEKRKKLIIYINPPYAEVSSKNLVGKVGVNQSITHDRYGNEIGTAGRELFTLFLARIYNEIPDCIIAEFSTLKTLNAPAFEQFRNMFKAKLKKGFIVPANTFDNVDGQFPIGFKIWDTSEKVNFESISFDVFNADNVFIGTKTIRSYERKQLINKWISQFKDRTKPPIGYMDGINANDFQNYNKVYVLNKKEQIQNPRGIWITEKNLYFISIYFAARHCIKPTWLNDRDQFLYPNDDYKKDAKFQNDCLIFTLFHGQNRISCKNGINHWIPFSEQEINAKEKFESRFMSGFLKNRKLSGIAQQTLDTAKKLWIYYYSQTKKNKTTLINASLYDIREYFQGRNDKGKMNNKSDNETYNLLIADLRDKLKALADKIQTKIYEYGFLR
ncbi:MAG: hypothetical protein LBB88_08830 [Planctomycetaceae bacterium]|jgi:hypothetical protein|nr:hypothetical protein [Planctomycetaceae bacterium]